jgi:hypothetical protein
MLERNLPIVFYEATAGNLNQTTGLLKSFGYKLFNAQTLQALDDTYSYDVVGLHREKHLGGSNEKMFAGLDVGFPSAQRSAGDT